MRTPSAIAAVRGTEFTVAITGSRETLVEVVEGLVAVTALRKGEPVGAERLVAAGQSARVVSPRPVSASPAVELGGPNFEPRLGAPQLAPDEDPD